MAASRSTPRSRSVSKTRTEELAALGLKPTATAAQITKALNKKYGGATQPPVTDPRTGLPYTKATAKAAGSGNLTGNILGGAVAGFTIGSIIDGIAGAITSAGGEAGGASGAAGAGADTGSGATSAAGAGGAGGGSGAATGAAGGGLFGSVASAIESPLDFLMLIAWIFHPRNILRAVEFLTGLVLLGFGFWAAMQARGESREGYSTGELALSRSGLGRVSRAFAFNKRRGGGGGKRRVESAPHRTRREALRQRYTREEQVRRRSRNQ